MEKEPEECKEGIRKGWLDVQANPEHQAKPLDALRGNGISRRNLEKAGSERRQRKTEASAEYGDRRWKHVPKLAAERAAECIGAKRKS